MAEISQVIAELIPEDHARQVHVREVLSDRLASSDRPVRLLDLGCGDGRILDIANQCPNIQYFGIDIEDSPEVRSRTRTDGSFMVYDGLNIPFPDDHFDVIYCCSVLEHVRYPDQLMRDVTRVLTPGGAMLGSVSFLEPYHSYSIFNFTPYGIVTVLRDAGLTPKWLRPGIDGLSIITRALLGKPGFFNRWFHRESPINRLLGIGLSSRGRSIREQNAAKLSYCGHIIFCAEKPAQ